MGIPYYFYKIASQHKHTISSFSQKCDRLFLDFNGIIHNSYNSIKHNVSSTESPSVFENILIDNVITYMESIIHYTKPRYLVYICIDGVAPLSKIIQQRKRRYLSIYYKSKVKETGYKWDSNAISPGTNFMNKLNDRLEQYKTNLSSTYEIIISNSSEKGEGEHKIFDYIHFHPKTNFIDVIYGLDADLIMLSLICNKSKKFLLREPQHFKKQSDCRFLWLNIEYLKSSILSFYDNKISIHSYVFLCFLLGNDFLPNLTYVNIQNNGIDKLLDAYLTVIETYNYTQIVNVDDNDKYDIDINIFLQIIELLSKNEDSEFKTIHEKYYQKKMMLSTINSRVENYGILNKNELCSNIFNSTNWRKAYYINLFDMNIYDDDTIEKSCILYIQGLYWIINYYFNKESNTFWFYPYNYSPSILDVYNFITTYINEIQQTFIHFEKININTDLQLLMILPVQSKHILNKNLQDIMCTPNEISYCYPSEYYIETYLKTKLHECHPSIPIIDYTILNKHYLKLIS